MSAYEGDDLRRAIYAEVTRRVTPSDRLRRALARPNEATHPVELPDPVDDDNYLVEAEHGLTVIASKGGPRAYDDHDPMAHATADEWDAYEIDDPEVRDVPSP